MTPNEWKNAIFPHHCWMCGFNPATSQECRWLETHHIDRKGHSTVRADHSSNYFLTCNVDHAGALANMPHAMQLAYKIHMDSENYSLREWLMLRDPALRAPDRVTEQEITKEYAKMFGHHKIPDVHNFKNLRGRRFGRLLVLCFGGRKKKKSMWKCRCDCGKIIAINSSNLLRGDTKSCGCLRSELLKVEKRTHGLSGKKILSVWHAMIGRCFNQDNPEYVNYGGRGIAVCDRWKNDPKEFYSDMGDPPAGMSLGRIDNDGDYSPDNCRWETMSQQNRNSRRTVLVTHGGKTQCLKDWALELGIPYDRVIGRRRCGQSDLQALGLEQRVTMREVEDCLDWLENQRG